MSPTEEPLRVAYLASQHPAPSQAFIDREIAGLRARDVDVTTFSVRAVPPELLLDPAMRAEAGRTTVLQADRRAVASAVTSLVRAEPRAFASVLRRALRTGEATVRRRVWQGFYLAEAVVLYQHMVDRGLRQLHVHFANNAVDIARLAVAIGRSVDGPGSPWRWSFTMHGPTEFEAVERFDLAAKVRDADGVACISDFARSQLMRLVESTLWPELAIVRMSVDLDHYSAPAVPRDHGGPLRLLSVGRLVPEKGSPVLLDAVAQLVRRGLDVRAVLAGGGELAGELERRSRELGLSERVELLGAVGQDRLPGLYQWADVFCLPSFQEGLPVVLMEAMACELPVVTTAIAGIPELVRDGTTGCLVPPGRADLVADAVQSLAEDPASARRMAAAARRLVEAEFSAVVTTDQQLAFLRGIRPRDG